MSSEVKLRSAKLAPMVSSGFKEKPINSSSSNITKTLTNEQTCEKRNTHLHNLCIQMLRDGFHRAYTELFNLVENRRKARIAAGPGSHLSLEIKLENENNYLDKLKDNLCSAEANERSKSYHNQYKDILELANYFKNEDVTWLSDHFYHSSLKIAAKVSLDSGRSQCEANEKCGLAAETRGEYGKSREFLIDARKISRGRTNWKHDNGITWHQQNSMHLARILIKLAASQTDDATVTKILTEAIKAADESKIELSISQVYYNYGCHLHYLGEIQPAHEALEKGLNNAIDIENYELIQKFGKELSSVSKKMKNSKSSVAIDRAAEYLKLAVDKTKTDPVASIDALLEVALLYNTYGDYNEATNSIDQAYTATNHDGCSSREISTRVAAGTIHGNQKLLSYRSVLANSTSDQNTVRQMMKWKNEADLNII